MEYIIVGCLVILVFAVLIGFFAQLKQSYKKPEKHYIRDYKGKVVSYYD